MGKIIMVPGVAFKLAFVCKTETYEVYLSAYRNSLRRILSLMNENKYSLFISPSSPTVNFKYPPYPLFLFYFNSNPFLINIKNITVSVPTNKLRLIGDLEAITSSKSLQMPCSFRKINEKFLIFHCSEEDKAEGIHIGITYLNMLTEEDITKMYAWEQ
ncbi:MAG: hypothetical protein KAX49_14075 [Halanaerobiales bacterium]|nr:hypothetical protein [Halanaerobiales bacterium]